MSQYGKLYLIPCPMGSENIHDVLPQEVLNKTIELRYFAVENIKTTRRYLRKIDREFPIDDSTFHVLNKKTEVGAIQKMLRDLKAGHDMGVMSEAGCPGVADPGGKLVALAHQAGIRVAPLVGPSSILLTVMGSGMNGQSFSFHGYLPKERKDRIYQLKHFEAEARRNGTTHLFMDTPFRNMHVLDDLLNELSDATMLCIGSNLTSPTERIQTMSVKDWRENAFDLNKIPTLFAIGKIQ